MTIVASRAQWPRRTGSGTCSGLSRPAMAMSVCRSWRRSSANVGMVVRLLSLAVWAPSGSTVSTSPSSPGASA
jgi:hypothetical protein